MDMKKVEPKWQEIWEKNKLYSFNKKNVDKKFYCLEMFSYPSASKLHLGHWYNYGLTDSGRFSVHQDIFHGKYPLYGYLLL